MQQAVFVPDGKLRGEHHPVVGNVQLGERFLGRREEAAHLRARVVAAPGQEPVPLVAGDVRLVPRALQQPQHLPDGVNSRLGGAGVAQPHPLMMPHPQKR